MRYVNGLAALDANVASRWSTDTMKVLTIIADLPPEFE